MSISSNQGCTQLGLAVHMKPFFDGNVFAETAVIAEQKGGIVVLTK